ncbi:cytochrome P450 2C28-like [Amblyomma americanum]
MFLSPHHPYFFNVFLLQQSVSEHWIRLALSLVFCALLFALIESWIRRPRIPTGKRLAPGPKGLPLVGHLPFARKVFDHKGCVELSKKYGPVIRFKVGVKDVVILNDFESIKEVLTRKEMLHRSQNLIFDRPEAKGILALNGDAWQDNRRFCLHVLRDLGFGKKSMEEHIKDEAEYLADIISELRGSPVDVKTYLVPSISNNITALVFGSRYPFDDHRRKFLDQRLGQVLKLLGAGNLLTFTPGWLSALVGVLPFTTIKAVQNVFGEVLEYISQQVKEHEETLEESVNRDFIDAFIKKMRETKDNPHSSYQMKNLIGNVGNFFGAGSNTVQMTIHWHLLNCADKPYTVQRSIQKEVDDVIGRERQPRWEDNKKMPYTMATIWEMYRWRTVAPLSIPREAAADSAYNDYFIPKGTIVMPNLWAVHMDPRHWKNPEDFNPHRFLNKDGSGLNIKPDQLIPFSIGRRMCPGETLATVEIFLYLTTLLQKFTVLPPYGASIDLEPTSLAFNIAAPQKLLFLRRQ